VSLPEVLEAIESIDAVDPLHCSAIATKIRERRGQGARQPTATDIERMLHGLTLLVPEALSVTDQNIMFGAKPARVVEAIRERVSHPPIKPTLKDLESVLGDIAS